MVYIQNTDRMINLSDLNIYQLLIRIPYGTEKKNENLYKHFVNIIICIYNKDVISCYIVS